MPGKGRATGYSDYYKGKSVTPQDATSDTDDDVPSNMTERQKAMKRRLKVLKAGK